LALCDDLWLFETVACHSGVAVWFQLTQVPESFLREVVEVVSAHVFVRQLGRRLVDAPLVVY
jgi:hypothetical protein